mmetsp:Transcript_13917/g.39576  ORF Transcript_13917/g.39576 Transcript_13917/m.39576 type:complete len:391 (-) Transcript_13917:467-1639(-)
MANVAAVVHEHCRLEVPLLQHIAQILAALQLIRLEPLVDQLQAPLGQHHARELQGLDLVQLTLLQEDAKVLQHGGRLARLGRRVLEALDGLDVAHVARGRVCRHLCRRLIVALLEELLELAVEEVVRPRQPTARGEVDGQPEVLQRIGDVRDDVFLIHSHGQYLPAAVYAHDPASSVVGRRHEDGVRADAVHVDGRGGREVKYVQVPELCHHVDDLVLVGHLHRDRKVPLGVRRVVDISRLALEALRLAHLRDEELRGRRRARGEADERARCVGPLHLVRRERRRMPLDELVLLRLRGVQLDGPPDATALALRDADEDAPLLILADAVVNDLAPRQIRVSRKLFSRRPTPLDGPVVHRRRRDDGHRGARDPLPELHRLRHLVPRHLLLHL